MTFDWRGSVKPTLLSPQDYMKWYINTQSVELVVFNWQIAPLEELMFRQLWPLRDILVHPPDHLLAVIRQSASYATKKYREKQ